MNQSKIILLVNEAVRLVRCIYEVEPKVGDPGRQYTFKCLDPTVRVDDYVVVQTNTRHGMTVVQVKEVDLEPDFDDGIELKWVIGRVDYENFQREVLSVEADAIMAVRQHELKRKRAELRQSMLGDDGLANLEAVVAAKSLPAE